MASSSLSQEDVDHDFQLSSRRSRIRTARASARNAPSCRMDSAAAVIGGEVDVDGAGGQLMSGTAGNGLAYGHAEPCSALPAAYGTPGNAADQDASPKPGSRAKDKRCPRPNHVNKGKAQRERRKLREKRRSTGVVHLPSTESTGGSTGEDEDELLNMSAETKRNTTFNECPLDKDQPPFGGTDSPLNENAPKLFSMRNTKSPSDLDADDEDNQDYDSAIKQSDSTASLVQEEPSEMNSLTPIAVNGRPETPCTENLEELLDRAREEIQRLLELLKEKDERILYLERQVSSLTMDLLEANTSKEGLEEENKNLLQALADMKVK